MMTLWAGGGWQRLKGMGDQKGKLLGVLITIYNDISSHKIVGKSISLRTQTPLGQENEMHGHQVGTWRHSLLNIFLQLTYLGGRLPRRDLYLTSSLFEPLGLSLCSGLMPPLHFALEDGSVLPEPGDDEFGR